MLSTKLSLNDDKLTYFRKVSLTAAHCVKTIILSGLSGNMVLKQYMRILFGGIVEYLISVAALENGEQGQEETIRSVDELFKACSGFFTSIPAEKRKYKRLHY